MLWGVSQCQFPSGTGRFVRAKSWTEQNTEIAFMKKNGPECSGLQTWPKVNLPTGQWKQFCKCYERPSHSPDLNQISEIPELKRICGEELQKHSTTQFYTASLKWVKEPLTSSSLVSFLIRKKEGECRISLSFKGYLFFLKMRLVFQAFVLMRLSPLL